jgi:hypothetical protein
MSKAILRFRTFVLLALIGLALSACALGRSVVEVSPPASSATDSKAFVKIVAVRDLRKFEESPSDAGTPSLQNAADIKDSSITSRAFARKRGGFGAALGDIVLPPGHTVAGLVQGAAQKALVDKGYAVVDSTSPHYATALPLSIDIVEFWEWFSPGAFSVRIDFKSTLNMTGDALVGPNMPPVTSHIDHEGMAAFESDYIDLVQRGVDDLSMKIEERINPAAGHG